ncbi:MAG TPA: FIST N-terminal domain-containing protein [Candidatus Limnocylindria bacterium]|nr:FIST N-terminal domain-containing protein [Candidatus Limnocylindria bacterium]
MEDHALSPRWMAVGRSDRRDAGEAGADAARQALAGGDDPRLLIVFAADRFDAPALLAGIRSVAPTVPLIGCSTAGEIASSGPGEAGVVVTALGGAGFRVATRAAARLSAGLRAGGAAAAQALDEVAGMPYRVLLLLADGLAGDQQEIVRGAYGVAGAAVPLVGGCAGDDLRMVATRQFHDDRVLTDAVVAAAVGSEAPFGIGVRHGWRRVGEPMLVSASSGSRVMLLDDRPALDAYLMRLDAPDAARTDAAAFTAFAQTHPLGLARRSGEEHVRFVAEADFERRELVCIAEVPTGGLAWLMEGDASSVLDATDAACIEALSALGGRPPLGLLTFDCIARKSVLGVGVGDEVARVASHAGEAPVAGFYTYGEIARTRGVTGFHNQTLVVLALS